MAEITDIKNEFIRDEIDEFIENPDERKHMVNLFARTTPAMQAISAALIEGSHTIVDQLTKEALEEGTEALEVMDDGLIAGMGIVGIKFRAQCVFDCLSRQLPSVLRNTNVPQTQVSLSVHHLHHPVLSL